MNIMYIFTNLSSMVVLIKWRKNYGNGNLLNFLEVKSLNVTW